MKTKILTLLIMDFTAISLTLSPHPSQFFVSAFYPGDLESTHIQVVVDFLIRDSVQNGGGFPHWYVLSHLCELRLS